MTKKLIVCLVLVALAVLILPAPRALEANDEVRIKTQIRVASWDIWQHADGVTWQETGAPGDRRSYAFDVAPPDVRGYTKLRYEMVAGVTQEQFLAAGGRAGYPPDEAGWRNFIRDVMRHTPDNSRKSGNNQVSFTLAPAAGAKRITKEWQAELVQGLRWYLPAIVYWYGTPTAAQPTTLPAGGLYSVDDMLGLAVGDTVTFGFHHERVGSAERITFRIYTFETKIGNIASWHRKPPGAKRHSETSVNFPAGWGRWSKNLSLAVPNWGQELGYYITTSETNFGTGVILSAAAEPPPPDMLSRGVQYENWHATANSVSFFRRRGDNLELGAAGVQYHVDRWQHIRPDLRQN